MKRRLFMLIMALILLWGSALADENINSNANADDKSVITAMDQLGQPGMRIAVWLDTPAEEAIMRDYPEAELIPYSDIFLAYTDVATGRVDACINARREMEFAIEHGFTGVRLLDEDYMSCKIAVGISPVTKIPEFADKLNAFIAEKKADGTLSDMYERWVTRGDETMPDITPADNPAFTLRVGTTGNVMPYSYYVGTELAGYDIELAQRFAAWLGAKLEFKVYDFGGIIAAAEAGSIDCIMSNLFYTDEKDESIPFSDVLFEVPITAMVRDDGQAVSTTNTAESAVSWRDYNGKRLGVLTGPPMEDAAKEYFPDSEYIILNSYPDCIAALQAGKVDAYLADEPSMKMLHAEQPTIDYIHERITQNSYSFAFRKNDPNSAALCAELNEFLAKSWADGTMQELDDIWFGADEDRKLVDMTDLTGENGTIRVVTTSTDAPFSYIKDGKNVGYDIDLVVRFCREMGYALELGDVDFAGRIPAIESGKYDFTTDMNVTPEREEEVLFSDPTSYGGIVLAVPSSDINAISTGASGSSELRPIDFNGRRAGVITGSFHDSVIADELPDSTINQYNNYSDMIAALKSKKIDYFLASTEAAGSMTNADSALTTLKEPIRILDIGAMFAKNEAGDALKAQMDEFIERIKADGTLDAIYAYWSDTEHESTPVDMSGLTGENGSLRFATSGTKVPISFVAEGQIAGTDPDIAVRFCREYGYGIDVNIVDTAGIIPGLVTGMYDFALSDMVITDERKESVGFSVPYHGTELLVVTLRENAAASAAAADAETGFFADLANSFNKTFIREGRWQLFVEGVLTTLLITLLTILCGTALGFAIYMLCRGGNRAANLVTRFCLWLVQGMPMVVLLMVLYYVIFASVAISGVAVAVIGFTLTFGAGVFGLLKLGVGAVDSGQYEAAYALGYSSHRTFFKIILPQALPHVLPAYRGEIVGLIKATAIVGYIAVQDLTKMGDIVRSRTYEAFFPLIAVTVIYFVLEGLIGLIVSRIGVNLNPKRRTAKRILKGVKTDD